MKSYSGSSSSNEQNNNNKRRVVLPSLGGGRSRQPLGTLSAADDDGRSRRRESFDNNNDVTLGTLQTNSSASTTGSSSLHSGQSSLTGRPPRATAATKNDGEEYTSNSISSILSSQTTKNERVLRYGETMDSLFCLDTTVMGDGMSDSNNNNYDEERHRTLCQEICTGTKSNNVVAWKEVLELSLERNNSVGEGGNSQRDVGKRLILLHRRATSRFKLVNNNNNNSNNTTTDDHHNDKKDKHYILQIWLLYAMVLLKYNNEMNSTSNNNNNDPRQTIKHIQRLYFNKCSNDFYSALFVGEEEKKKKKMDLDQVISTLQQLLVSGTMSVVEIVKCQMHQLELCGLVSTTEAAEGLATTNTDSVGRTVAATTTTSVAPVRLISLPSLGNKKGGTNTRVLGASSSSSTVMPASQRIKTNDDHNDGNDKSTLLSSSYQRTKRPLKSISRNSDSEGGGDSNGTIKPSSIRAKLESRKKKMKTTDRGPHPYRTRRGSSSSGNQGGGLRAILSQTLEEGDDESSDNDDDDDNNNNHSISAKRSADSCTSVASSNMNDSHLFQDISPIDQEPTTSVKDMDLNYLLNWDPTKRSDATALKTKKRVTIVAEDAKKKTSSSSSTTAIPKITKNDLGYMMNWNPFDKFENKKDDDVDSLDKSSRVEEEGGVVVHQSTTTARGKNNISNNKMSTIDEATEGSLTSGERENNHAIMTSQSRASCSSQEESNEMNTTKSESKKRSSRSSVGTSSDSRNEENEKSSSSISTSHASENTNMISTTKLDCSFLPLIEKKNIIRVENDSYAKLGVIGKGGSCKVYRALSHDCDVVALKKVKLDGLNKAAIDGYANEIALLKRLKGNPAIIQLYSAEVDLERKSILLVMELGEVDLNYVLRQQELLSSKQHGNRAAGGSRSSLNMNFIRLTWQQMLTAVHSIHEERIIHSDLKPANFLFVRGALKLIDFGIAKAIEREDTTNVYRETLSGTLSYMSPEAIMDTSTNAKGVRVNKCGRPSDIWSLGCILYQMVYGKTPFADCHGIPQKVLAITNVNHQINFPDGVDESAINAMKVCLNRDPKQRPPIVGPNGLLNEHCFLHRKR